MARRHEIIGEKNPWRKGRRKGRRKGWRKAGGRGNDIM
jgi:hypothetical protein